jgi:hypothetical protein
LLCLIIKDNIGSRQEMWTEKGRPGHFSKSGFRGVGKGW